MEGRVQRRIVFGDFQKQFGYVGHPTMSRTFLSFLQMYKKGFDAKTLLGTSTLMVGRKKADDGMQVLVPTPAAAICTTATA